jgi:hypothetical protein
MTIGRIERHLITRRLGRHLGIALAAGLTFAGVRYVIGVQDPGEVPIPTPAMPAVNAFEDYRRAGAMVHNDADRISRAANPAPTPIPGQPTASELLERHRDALATLRAGFGKPCQMPAVRDFDALLPYYADFRALGQLLVMEGKEKEADGDITGAAQSYRDAVRFGADISQGGPLIGHLVSLAVGTMGRKALWNLVPRLDAATAKETAAFLESVGERQMPIVAALEEEKYGGQKMLLTIFRSPEKGFTLTEEAGYGQSALERILPLIYIRWSKRDILNNYTAYMDGIIAQARQPYQGRIPEPDLRDTDPLTSLLAPVFSGVQFTYTRARADHALLMTSCALQAYRREGVLRPMYPARLEELVSHGYLKSLPTDGFAGGSPLRYTSGLSENGREIVYRLWSVGPDRRDDAGTPLENRNRPGDRHAVQIDSAGDMVAGVNH